MTISFHKIKNRLSKYFLSTAWPWEIMSGLFIVIIIINNYINLIKNQVFNRVDIALLIISVNLLWAVVDGLLVVFTNLLERGRYNKLVSTIKTTDKNSATQIIESELNRTIVSTLDQKDRRLITETVRESILLLATDTSQKSRLLPIDIYGAITCIFLVMLPSIVILPSFVLIKNIFIATLVSNFIAALLLFLFGYKLGSHIKRSEIFTGFLVVAIGLVVVFLGTILGA